MLFKLDKKFSLNSIERKLNKLKREPDQFFKDMMINRKEQVQKTVNKVRPVKCITKNKFTIVSAVYNVGRYLDDYFESIVNQSVSFKDSLYIICVDDGSTDNSSEIIKKWQKKYPRNIKYIYKENGGQSSARNLGLNYVKTDWVTMIDPDDFLHVNFFSEIDKELIKNKNLKLIAPNFIFYYEDKDVKQDTHPLRYRYTKDNIVKCEDLNGKIHLHAASTIFDFHLIKSNNLKFNSDVKPNFEDGKFIADYLLLCLKSNMSFCKAAIYYYRKRSDSSSTLDTAWSKVEKYTNVLEFGYLEMLDAYMRKSGYIPKHIQRTVLYDVAWYIHYLMNCESRVDFLSTEQKNTFIEHLLRIFEYIQVETIISFNLAGTWFKHKVGMLGCFKKQKPHFQIAYIENIDKTNKQILINVFSTLDCSFSFKLNGIDTVPVSYKVVENHLLHNTFVNEHKFWIKYENLDDIFSVHVDEIKAKLSILGKEFNNNILVSEIVTRFTPSYKYNVDDSWIFIDRDMQADDNAEYLYRYILNNNLKTDCYFALSKDSADWDRLQDEGFKLIDFGSDVFESKLKRCSKIISSNVDHYITNYFGDEYEYSKKIVFLQHGVIHNDLSLWLNTQKNINLFITSTQDEYSSIVDDKTHYKFSSKEVKLTGMPRHDYLLKSDHLEEKIILVMPTWRKNIVGKAINNSNTRAINNNFKNEAYCKAWEDFLNDQKLKNLYKKYGYKIVFAPHVNIVPYLSVMDIPPFIDVWSKETSSESLQTLFKKTKVFITDYSSAAFDLAYLNKAIIYFQFDKNEFFSGVHTSQLSYFEYERDGFGPIVEEVEQVEQALEQILKNDGKALEPYLTRMQETFKFKDERCCERVYNAIVTLDHEDNSEDIKLAHTFLNQAYEFKNYVLVQERAEKLLLHPELTASEKQTVYAKLAESYAHLQDWDALELLLREYHNDYYATKLLATQVQWEEILNIIGRDIIADEYFVLRMSSLFNLNQLQAHRLQHLQTDTLNLSEYENNISQCYVDYVNQDWENLAESLEQVQFYIELHKQVVDFYVQDDFAFMQLMVGKHLNQLDLTTIRVLDSKKTDFILQKSLILSKLNDPVEALKGFALTEKNQGLSYFDLEALKIYITDLFDRNAWNNLVEKLPECSDLHPNEAIFKEYFVQTLGKLAQWKDLVQFYKEHTLDYSQCSLYFIVLAHYRIGEVEEAYSLLVKPTTEFDYEYWLLVLEIYMQTGDEEQIIHCLKRMYAIFPEKMKETKDKFDTLSKLFSLN